MQYLHLKFTKNLEQSPHVIAGNIPLNFQNLSLILNIGLFVYGESYLSTCSVYEKIRTNTQIKVYSLKKENLKEGNKLELSIRENPLLCWNNVLPTWQTKKQKRKYVKKDKGQIEKDSSIIQNASTSSDDDILKDIFETLDKK